MNTIQNPHKLLALQDEILLQIEKPVRYIGNEINSVIKTPEDKVRFAMCFPDVYEIPLFFSRKCGKIGSI